MNNENWQDQNDKYLAASLDWLRLKLWSLAPKQTAAAQQPVPIQPSEPRPKWSFGRKSTTEALTQVAVQSLPKTATPSLPGATPRADKPLDDAANARQLAAQITPAPALVQLAEEFRLSDFERDLLLICAAVEFDAGFGSLISQTTATPGRDYPTFGLALALLDEPHWDALSAHRPLRTAKLIEINQPGSTPLTLSGLRADERILAFIKGTNALDDRLSALVTEVTAKDQTGLVPSQQQVCDDLLAELHTSISDGVVPLVQLLGKDGMTKIALASHVCEALGSGLLRVTTEALPTGSAELDSFAKLWQRETCLLPVALYIEAEDLDSASDGVASGVGQALVKVDRPGVRGPTRKRSSAAWAIRALTAYGGGKNRHLPNSSKRLGLRR